MVRSRKGSSVVRLQLDECRMKSEETYSDRQCHNSHSSEPQILEHRPEMELK